MPNTIQFWLSYNNGAERLQLPVNPEYIQISQQHRYDDVLVSHLGEFTIIGDAKLRDFSFSSFFPRDYHSSYCEYEGVPDPWATVEMLERWRDSRKPCRLTVTGTPINYAVTIRSFEIVPEKHGAPGDIYYDIALKEYKFVSIRQIDMSAKKSDGTAKVKKTATRGGKKDVPKPYVVKKGDCLSVIAARYGLKTRDVYAKNKAVVGPDPNRIYPGQKLVLV
ncbi:LysM peptidoglycan-binding domain-containing protein [Brevibacillus laterosporus]|uniref:LysM peptidoglycan-binding domain-containing protein n=1 Tax=Brevibacillus laterosporus TaxID=1465 RepID=A0A518V9F7_BRELA|nr:LysM peptidoglycan-binding domain-containing protein [Brevibacillus laterosporus]